MSKRSAKRSKPSTKVVHDQQKDNFPDSFYDQQLDSLLKSDEQIIDLLKGIYKRLGDNQNEESPDNPNVRMEKRLILWIFMSTTLAVSIENVLIIYSLYISCIQGNRYTIQQIFQHIYIPCDGWDSLTIFQHIFTECVLVSSDFFIITEYIKIKDSVDNYKLDQNNHHLQSMGCFIFFQLVIFFISIVANQLIPDIISRSTVILYFALLLISMISMFLIYLGEYIRKVNKTSIFNFASIMLAIISLAVSALSIF